MFQLKGRIQASSVVQEQRTRQDLFTSGPNLLNPSTHSEMHPPFPSAPIGEITIRHREKQAGDSRDKIYSILSLINPEQRDRMGINYSPNNKAHTLFKFVAILIVTEEKNLGILAENKTFRGQKFPRYSR